MAKKPSPTYQFVAAQLRENPELTFHRLKDLGEAAGFKVMPVVYGRAKALLGLVPVVPYGEKKRQRARRREDRADKSSAANATPAPVESLATGPAEAGGASEVASEEFLEQFIGQIEQLRRQRDQAVAMLQQIKALLESLVAEEGGEGSNDADG